MSLRALGWLCFLITIVVLFYAPAPQYARRDTLERAYAPLLAADAMVREHYVAPVAREQLVEGAVRGMMRELDPYSSYLSTEELDACRRRLAGEQVDIGVELGMAYGQPVVIAAYEGSTAAAAGLAPGDVIVAVDGASTANRSIFAVEAMLFGAADSKVRLDVYRPRDETRMVVSVDRRAVRAETVRGIARTATGWRFMIDASARIGYVRITRFAAGTQAAFELAWEALRAAGVRGLVLDLRFNPGGALEPALALADHFLADGVILTTRPRVGAEERYLASSEIADTETPVVALINGSSASAAEMVAGALQDRGRATVVGTRSFGKSSVQHFMDLPEGRGGVRVTSAYYVLPGGRIIHRSADAEAEDDWGVMPDVEVALDADERAALHAAWRGLDSGRDEGEALVVDRQLARALDELRRLMASSEVAPTR